MKITVEIPNDLYREAKAAAALQRRKLKDLIAEGLRMVLQRGRKPPRRTSLAALMKGARGIIDSGIPDLGSNSKHLAGFGRRSRGR
ncbi:MAG TPA: hypothetical protein VGX95_01385 [Xanthobacteraceae bacterium]|jgi:hypothetical protein|nr:hypothetical protein [Xanthobacteraceae bacterium]